MRKSKHYYITDDVGNKLGTTWAKSAKAAVTAWVIGFPEIAHKTIRAFIIS